MFDPPMYSSVVLCEVARLHLEYRGLAPDDVDVARRVLTSTDLEARIYVNGKRDVVEGLREDPWSSATHRVAYFTTEPSDDAARWAEGQRIAAFTLRPGAPLEALNASAEGLGGQVAVDTRAHLSLVRKAIALISGIGEFMEIELPGLEDDAQIDEIGASVKEFSRAFLEYCDVAESGSVSTDLEKRLRTAMKQARRTCNRYGDLDLWMPTNSDFDLINAEWVELGMIFRGSLD